MFIPVFTQGACFSVLVQCYTKKTCVVTGINSNFVGGIIANIMGCGRYLISTISTILTFFPLFAH
ncbi:MAG: hypothetical protein ACI9LM_002096 [Alteromonadaceae bacterium]|jgi:hypothetical protein